MSPRSPVNVSIEHLMTELRYLIILPANTGSLCRRSRRVKNSRLPVSQIGQNDNDRAVQVRRVDGQPVTGHPIANEQGSHVKFYGATIGVDFLRLTVYRTALSSFWPNPFPPARVAYGLKLS